MVEAVAEDLRVKKTLFENLDEICKPGAILATTTSSLPVIALRDGDQAAAGRRRLHFFNPAPVMQLVEVVPTVATDDEVAETVRALCAEGRQARGVVRRPGRASSSTRCCSRTSTTR